MGTGLRESPAMGLEGWDSETLEDRPTVEGSELEIEFSLTAHDSIGHVYEPSYLISHQNSWLGIHLSVLRYQGEMS